MDLQRLVTLGIILHALAGGIALLSGAVSIIARKGLNTHKKSGKVFYYAMLLASSSGMIVAVIPGHLNPFLFVVGVFSGYLTLTGYRALRFKRPQTKENLKLDYVYAYTMLTTAILMIASGTYVFAQGNSMGSVLIIFGIIGFLNSITDLRSFRNLKALRKKWLLLHIGKISGAYIAALTAFIVVNQAIPGVWGWLMPTVLGVIFIVYWSRKVKKGPKPTVQS